MPYKIVLVNPPSKNSKAFREKRTTESLSICVNSKKIHGEDSYKNDLKTISLI
ncbi:MAG: hypothetical protein H0X72_07795 [Acidobacteria bacterium]|nr:hypothetical protein [Acidobacteriota bacterium]